MFGLDDATSTLTPKERQVHDLLVLEGLTDGEMAARLGMTERAVKFHVQNLLQKAEAPDRFKMAVAFWRAWSGYDEQVEDAPRPVRRRGEPALGARGRGRAAKKASARKGRAKAKAKAKAAGKKKAATKTKASAKKAAGRKVSARKAPATKKKAPAKKRAASAKKAAAKKPTAKRRASAKKASAKKRSGRSSKKKAG